MRATQMELSFFCRAGGRGGARPGAGRKRLPAHLRHTPHRARPAHRAAQPVQVTLRACTRSLRTRFVAKTVMQALRDSNSERFRIAHYSVQENHVHLIVEAEDKRSLSSGVRGLMVRVARRVNRLLFRRGRFWADRWHGRSLTGPSQVRNALVYVLQNRMKHGSGVAVLDAFSSAQWFHGFAEALPHGFRGVGPPCIAPARTWLLRVGWATTRADTPLGSAQRARRAAPQLGAQRRRSSATLRAAEGCAVRAVSRDHKKKPRET
jgi:putative transposase